MPEACVRTSRNIVAILASYGVTNYWDSIARTCEPYQDFEWTGAELCADPGFATPSLWTAGAGWTVSGDIATASSCSAELNPATPILDVRARYRILHTMLTSTAGTLALSAGSTVANGGAPRSATGTYNDSVACTANTALKLTGAGYSGTADNLSVIRESILTETSPLIGSTSLLQAGVAGYRPSYLTKAAAVVQGLTRSAFGFDGGLGGGQYFMGPVPNSTAGSMGCWFYLPSTPTGYLELCGSYDGTRYCELLVWTDNTLRFRLGTAAYTLTHSTTVAAGAWHHAMGFWNGATYALSLDGVVVSAANTGTASTKAVYFGAENQNGTAARNLNCFQRGMLLANTDIRSHAPEIYALPLAA
jgi:energy-converting hydrogenase Eha subunit B